ncbi:MAG: DUF4131 domain-containing protein, partial [Planctomycetaceae bacterium]|nr:DUF4131 domain-containing protein [Planctomycetaceae bacterium]
MPVALSLAAGIVVDRSFDVGLMSWLGLATLLLLGGVVLNRSRAPASVSAVLVLAFWGVLGGLRHHEFWSLRREDNIAACVPARATPTRLTGRVASPLVIDAADHSAMRPPWTQVDRTIFQLDCASVGSGDGPISASGRVRVDVTGHLLGPEIGDELELYGSLQRPGGPNNPGGFDYADWLRRQGVDAVVRVEHPDHVRRTVAAPTWMDRLARGRDRLRREAQWIFVDLLDFRQAPLATSLLLGDRSGLPRS